MNDASWALTALLTVGFLIQGFRVGGGLGIAWLVLGVGLAGITYVRFQAARKPRD